MKKMKELNIQATRYTPKVVSSKVSEFTMLMVIEGESYPENAMEFFKDIRDCIVESRENGMDVDITFNLSYFNSSSTVQLLDIFDTLSSTKYKGIVRFTWWCAEDDEDARDSIEELLADCSFEKRILVK